MLLANQKSGARILPAVVGAILLLAAPDGEARAQEGWPRQIDLPEAEIVVYQPQPETFEGNNVTARTALSITPSGSDTPVFGAVWLTSRLSTDRDTRTATIEDITVDRVVFPESTDEQQEQLSDILESEIPKWNLEISLDRLLTTLELADQRKEIAQGLDNTPPEILFSSDPAILLLFDGEPFTQDIEGSSLEQLVNTPYLVVLASNGRYYLYAGDNSWYEAPNWRGDWSLASSVPSDVAAITPEEEDIGDAADGEPEEEPGPPPRIVVATEPTELIVTEGEPEFAPIEGTDLLYMSNTNSDVLMNIGDQNYYAILSGRWYKSRSLEGPWTFISPDALPEVFAEIPSDSEMAHLLVSVSGTQEANEAVMDNQIPQTTAIDRQEASLEIEYDGDPEFEPIEDTSLAFAVNTETPVIRVDSMYYACDNGVWFVSNGPTGPWAVADSVPDDVYTIPPSSPVYNVTYVQVYDSTPDVVYVGYTPGYTGSYVYGGTVVYGTGYYYPYWYGTTYYARPATWGFHVRWNPWTGWTFGFSYSNGPFTFHIGFGRWGGWWGPRGYYPYRRGYRRGWRAGYVAGYRSAQMRNARRDNIYNRPGNSDRNRPSAMPADRQQPVRAQNRDNNVYADQNGNIHRRNQDGSWDQRAGDNWSPSQTPGQQPGERPAQQPSQQPSAQPAQRPSQQPSAQPAQRPTQQPSTRSSTQSQLNNSHSARQRGSTRSSNYGRSGGGGRRR